MHQTIFVATGTIRLGQLLKLAGLVDTGGEAKLRVQNGEVRVNGAVDTRRGRQLAPGDHVAGEPGIQAQGLERVFDR